MKALYVIYTYIDIWNMRTRTISAQLTPRKFKYASEKKKENMIGNIVRLDNFGFKTFSNQFLFHLWKKWFVDKPKHPLWGAQWESRSLGYKLPRSWWFISKSQWQFRATLHTFQKPWPWQSKGPWKSLKGHTKGNGIQFCKWWALQFNLKWKWAMSRGNNIF